MNPFCKRYHHHVVPMEQKRKTLIAPTLPGTYCRQIKKTTRLDYLREIPAGNPNKIIQVKILIKLSK